MRKITIIALMAMSLLACGRGKGGAKAELVPCVVDSVVADPIRSTLDFDRRCMVYLDCGVFFSSKIGRISKGDTVYCDKNAIKAR